MEEKNSEKKERKMRDSGIPWIGEVPEGWGVNKIKYHLTRNEIKNKPDKQVLSVYRDYGVIPKDSSDDNHNVTSEDTSKYKYVQKGDLVINKMKAWQGSLGVSKYEGIVSPAYYIYKFHDDSFDGKFFHYLIRGCYKDEFRRISGGIREGQWDLSAEKFENTMIIIPPIPEQHRIADFLDSKCSEIDNLIENLRARVESAKEYKKTVITEAVTKGLDKDAKMKDSGVEWIGEIPEGWKVARLKQVLKTPMKYGASESGVEYSDELPRYIRITDITLDNKLKDVGKLSLTEQQAIGYLLSEKTVLFARSGATVGKTFLYKPEYGRAAFAGYMISAIPNNNKIKAEWLYYYTLSQTYWDWVNSSFSQATIQNIGADKYSNLPIVIPSLITQQQIINYLDSKCSEIDALLQNYEDQIATLESLAVAFS